MEEGRSARRSSPIPSGRSAEILKVSSERARGAPLVRGVVSKPTLPKEVLPFLIPMGLRPPAGMKIGGRSRLLQGAEHSRTVSRKFIETPLHPPAAAEHVPGGNPDGPERHVE